MPMPGVEVTVLLQVRDLKGGDLGEKCELGTGDLEELTLGAPDPVQDIPFYREISQKFCRGTSSCVLTRD
jgi:hypothetical protein